MEMRTKTKDLIKKFIRDDAGVLLALVIVELGAYKIGYKSGSADGIAKGIKRGQGEILNEIVFASCEDGLIMNNSELGRYIFTAKKLNK